MACTCKTCWAWCPKEWEVFKFVDEVARCSHKGKFTTRNETCDMASIVKPKGVMNVTTQRVATQTVQQPTTAVTKRQPANQSVVRAESDLRDGNSVSDSDFTVQRLYKHQQDAVEYFDERKEIALFFEMGVGKSATVLAIAKRKFDRKEINALLIVAPNDVHRQWAMEQIPQWLDVPYEIQCFGGRGGSRTTYPFTQDPEFLQVVCVNIDTFSTPKKWQDIVEWANYNKTFIVLDEATTIKNPSAQRTQRMLYEFNDTIKRGKTVVKSTIRSVARAILTGTPVTNGAMDLWSLMEFLRPNFFGRNWYSFQNHFGMFTRMAVGDREIQVPLTSEWWHSIKACSSYQEAATICGCSEDTFNVVHSQDSYEGPYKHAEELKELIQPVSMFKQLKDCVDMPPQNYDTRTLTMSDEVRKCYDDMVNEFIATYEDHTMTALNKLSVMIRLQQISSGFLCDKNIVTDEDAVEDNLSSLYGLVDDKDIMPDEIKWIGTSNPKLERLYADIEELAKPVIILTRFTAEAARIYVDLNARYKCALFTGWKRVGTIEDFKAGTYPIMVANTAVVARGFNLQNSCSILFYSNTFSLEARLQAEGRIFRLGQTKPCQYIDYTYEDSIDEKIVGALKLKRNLLDYIRGTEKVEELV